jgi:hypothetical protein
MNIFYIHSNPLLAAQDLCDKHVVKMVLESTQILSSVLHRYGMSEIAPYKEAYPSHPCVLWAGDSRSHWRWLLTHAEAISNEYTLRYEKIHKCDAYIKDLKKITSTIPFPKENFTPPPQCMPEQYRHKDTTMAYKNYYIGEKSSFAEWNKNRPQPLWYRKGI